MASDQVLTFTDETFDEEVLSSDVPVLVDFWAEWCMPCKMVGPTIEEVATEYEGRVKVGKLDTDANRSVSVTHGITAIPTVMIFKGGKVVKQLVGVQPKKSFTAALDEVLG